MGVSADGTTIAGHSIDPSGHSEAWMADLAASAVPEPSAWAMLLLGFATKRLLNVVVADEHLHCAALHVGEMVKLPWEA
jgi:hypothetical protein